MDTDSSYKVLSGPMHTVIKKEKREEFFKNYGEWFVKPYCDAHQNDFYTHMVMGKGEWKTSEACCKKAKLYDSRTPGKFKEEFRGSVMIALNPKTYLCGKDENDLDREFPEPPNETEEAKAKRLAKRKACAQKYSSKGLGKKTNRLTLEDYKSVLRSHKSVNGLNTGFVKKDNVVYTYSQKKRGLTYFYGKRKVMADGVSTTHLDI